MTIFPALRPLSRSVARPSIFTLTPSFKFLTAFFFYLIAAPAGFSADLDVTWTNGVNVLINGNTIKKTHTTWTWNSGASSVATFSGNGGVDFTVPQIDKDVMCGLVTSDASQDSSSINYGILLTTNNIIGVYESGASRGIFGNYFIGDRFRVERVGTTVYYKRNGTTFYTSNVPSSGVVFVHGILAGNYYGGSDNTYISDVKTVGFTPGVASTISDLSAFSSTPGEVALNWSVPGNNGGPLTRYEVQYGTVASGTFSSTYTDDATAGATITGLTNETAYQFRVVTLNTYGYSSASNVVVAAPHAHVNVTWTNAVGVSVSTNTLTKTGTNGAWNSGASSVTSFGSSGGVDFAVTQTNTSFMSGLAKTDPDQNYTSINYALYPASGVAYVHESGTNRGSFGSYQVGDRFRVERIGTTVYYKKNGTVFYTSTVPSTGVLLVDSAMLTNGAVISDAKTVGFTPGAPDAVSDLNAYLGDSGEVKFTWSAPANNTAAITGYDIQYGTVASGAFVSTYNDDATPGATITGLTNGTAYQFRLVATNSYGTSGVSNVVQASPVAPTSVVWTSTTNVNVSGGTLTKTGGAGWNTSGAVSVSTFDGNGGVDFTMAQTTGHNLMVGLSASSPDNNYATIKYAAYAVSNSALQIYEMGTLKASVGTYVAGDRIKIERVGSTVYYKKNNTILYTSTVPSTGALMVDTSLYTTGGVVSDAKIFGFAFGIPGTVTDLLGTQANSGEIQLSWSAPGNYGSAITGYQVQYGTVASGAFASTYNDDATPGAIITGLTNGTQYQFRVVATNGNGTSGVSNVAQAIPATPLAVTWTSTTNVSVSGSTITKTGSAGWNTSGAVSVATFGGNGGVDFTVTSSSGHDVMAGLSASNPDNGYGSMNYAMYAASNGSLYVYELGNNRGAFGPYVSGDRLRVERVGTTVYYKRNNTILYTSLVASSGKLMVDTALASTGGVVSDAKIIGIIAGVPDAITNFSGTAGNNPGDVQFTWSEVANNGTAISNYQIQYGTVASGAFASTYNDDATPGATITGLTSGTAYQFRVVAINSAGAGAVSNVQTVTPQQRTIINGNITSNTTWTTAGNPYHITSNVNVTTGNTLTIDPGVTVYFDGSYYLAVAGTLSAQGTLANPILFSSGKVVTAKGDWQYIAPSGSSTIDYAIFEYGDKALKIDNVSPSVAHSTFRYNTTGIYLTNACTSSITHNKINKNTYGVYIYPSTSYTMNPTINYNDIVDNTTYDAFASGHANFSAVTINAENNWWGTTNTTTIASHIYDRADNIYSPLLDITPIATGSDTIGITSVSVSPQFFDPAAGSASINYTLDKAANVTVKIYRWSPNQLVRTLINNQSRSLGANAETWDGKDDAGQDLANDGYYYTIYAQDSSSRFGQYDPVFVPGWVTLGSTSVSPSSFNPYKGETASVSYTLSYPSLVTVRWKRYLVDTTDRLLFLDKPRSASAQTEVWDGRLDEGRIAPNNTYHGLLWATLMPDNTIGITRAPAVTIGTISADPYAIRPSFNETAEIQYVLSGSANVTVQIKALNGDLINTLVNNQSKSAGTHTVTWFGDNTAGEKMAGQASYYVSIDAVSGGSTFNKKGNIAVLKP